MRIFSFVVCILGSAMTAVLAFMFRIYAIEHGWERHGYKVIVLVVFSSVFATLAGWSYYEWKMWKIRNDQA